MTRIITILIFLCAATQLAFGADEPPVKLAIVGESPDAAEVEDLLAAEFTKNNNVQLLERTEIEKVYREQRLSAANRDYLKLGQVLGADGLLLLNMVKVPAAVGVPMAGPPTNILQARLVAVKPGVVLTAGSLVWPVKDTAQWSQSFAAHLDLLRPKLAVLVKDAIPISVVNLRSAVQSSEAAMMEREVKSLTIERLSRQQQFFVLERQKMQALSGEKDLKSDESAFWNGSYLLEGIIDQNGYSKDILTISARLTPPKGGQPILFEISGKRTNPGEVVNSLVAKVVTLLTTNSTVTEWNAADEAAQYFKEAEWALRWGAVGEAQAAADSAWALGKQDLACALVRGRSYLMEAEASFTKYQQGQNTLSPGYDVNGKPIGPRPSEADVQREIENLTAEHPLMTAVRVSTVNDAKAINYAFADKLPSMESLDGALRALELYQEFSRKSADGEPKVLWRGKGWSDWHDSEWYQLGIDDLTAASKVLRDFSFVRSRHNDLAGKLADLRSQARVVARLIIQSPTVHDGYFVGSRMVTHDELAHTIQENPNIFQCAANWGCFWQERPEDGVSLYRELMSSPVFCYIHASLWNRDLTQPRLIAWNEEDQRRLPQIWKDFVGELDGSTNVLLRMEAKGLMRADATNDVQVRAEESDWWSLVRANREELLANNVELFYLGWGFIYNSETEAMDQEYWQKTIPARQMTGAFEKQQQYLSSFTPYKVEDFNATFESRDYTKAQAATLKPLIAAYKSNLLAQLPATASRFDKFKAENSVHWIELFLERQVDASLNPAAPAPAPAKPPQTPQLPVAAIHTAPAVQQSVATGTERKPELVTNVLSVNKFLPIPLDGLPGDQLGNIRITAHHWLEGKLVLDFEYSAYVYSFDEKGNWKSSRAVQFAAIAILNPNIDRWQVIPCPDVDFTTQNRFYHRTTLYHGELLTSDDGQIREYNATGHTWQVLNLPDLGNCELFTVNDRLYAATPNLIVEILDAGTRTHILASNRRQPPVSALDTESLGTPALFAGPSQSLCAAIGEKIAVWRAGDWQIICPAPHASIAPMIEADSILFLADGWSAPAGIWRFAAGDTRVEFCMGPGQLSSGGTGQDADINSKPTWRLPATIRVPWLSTASRGTDLYFIVDHAKMENQVDEQRHLIVGRKILPQNGYHAALLCLATNDPAPQKVFLKFDVENAVPPASGDNHAAGLPNLPSSWLMFSSNYLFCGQENSSRIPGGGGVPGNSKARVGVWLIPLNQIDLEIARQRAAGQEERTRATQSLVEKYDRNHNGIIDIDEREQALDDPDFIKAQLDSIDANHNGWLDVAELAYFDKNHNKTLDTNELHGIYSAIRLLAGNLLNEYDQDGKGWLNAREYNELMQSGPAAHIGPSFEFQFPRVDTNHDNKVDLAELENLLRRYLEQELQPPGMRRPGFHPPWENGFQQSAGSGPDFKLEVEAYWQNQGHVTNHVPSHNPSPVGDGAR